MKMKQTNKQDGQHTLLRREQHAWHADQKMIAEVSGHYAQGHYAQSGHYAQT